MTLPSKKITPILLACLIASGTIVYALKYNAPASSKPASLIAATPLSASDIPVSDNTWKNTLAAVAPASSENQTVLATTTSAETQAPITQTQTLARDLLSNYLNLEQATGENGGLSQDAQDQLAEQVAFDSENSEPVSLQSKTYTAADLNNESDDSQAARMVYGNAVAAVILNNPPKGNTDTELSIMYQSVNDNDQSELQKLEPIITAYETMEQGILKVKTPPSAQGLQLNLVNDFDALVTVDKRLENFYADPVDGTYALKDYQTASVNIADDFQAFKMYFDSSNISFSDTDPAQQFINTM